MYTKSLVRGGGLLLTLSTLVLCPAALAGSGTPEWTVELPGEISWIRDTEHGIAVVGTKAGVFGYRIESGAVAWGLDDARQEDFEVVPLSPFALAGFHGRPGFRTLIDLRTGERPWDTGPLGLVEFYGSFPVLPPDALLIFARKGGDMTADVVMAVDLETGDLLWESAEIWADNKPPVVDAWRGRRLVAGNQLPLFDTDDTMILFLNGKRIRKYDVRDGSPVWDSGKLKTGRLRVADMEIEKVAAPLYGYDFMLLSRDGTRFFVPYRDRVCAFSTETGEALWKKAPGIDGVVTQMEETPAGLAVRTVRVDVEDGQHNFQVFDLETGKKKGDAWRHGGILRAAANVWTHSTNFVVHGNAVVFAAHGKLFALDLTSGKRRAIARLALEGAEHPWWLELHPQGYLVGSAQNLVLFGFDGQRKFHTYLEPPDGFDHGFDHLLVSLLLNQLPKLKIGSRVTVDVESDPMEAVYEMFRTYTATATAEDAVYMLEGVEIEEKTWASLVKIDKETGEPTGAVLLPVLSPDYVVDPSTGRVLVRTGKRLVSCFGL